MRYVYFVLLVILISSCGKEEKSHEYDAVAITDLYTDSVSIRAIEVMDGSLAFAGSKGIFGSVDLLTDKVKINIQKYDTIIPEFRAVAHTKEDFFMLSITSPALLYKIGSSGKMQLVYQETGVNVFYDAMQFWNDSDGIAIGDSTDGCLSIIITRDGGAHWKKIPCNRLPKAPEGEGAFAASNTNIKLIGNKAWVATTSSTVYYSEDKGEHWEVYQTPVIHQKLSQGIYSLDFYNESLGFAIGGDYTSPDENKENKAITKDGGKTWQLLADGNHPGYKSCVQYLPNAGGQDLVAVGFTGISYSKDGGAHWKALSKESFYTIRFINDSVAYAAGKNRISKLLFQ